MTRERWRPATPLLAYLTGCVALVAWSGMVAEPLGFLLPTVTIGLVLALVGSALRVTGLPWYAVATAQLAVAALSLNAVFASSQSLLGLVPTWDSLKRLDFVIVNGAASLNTYAAPVAQNPTHTSAMLTACGLGVLLAVDLLAIGLQRPPLAALPLLVTLSVPVSILDDPLALPVFVGVALLFLRLVATEHLERYGSWARRGATGGTVPGDDTRAPRRFLSMLWQVSVAAVVVALVAAPVVPVTDLAQRGGDGSAASSGGGNFELSVVNPFIRLRRDLVEKRHLPLVYAETEARSTSYIRTTVLDRFTSDEWRPSARNLPQENDADGVFPTAPGLGPEVGGTESQWSFELAPAFATTWLPLPYPVRQVQVKGNWRFDSRTLDVADVGGDRTAGLTYSATAFAPQFSASVLEGSLPAPSRIRRPMTAVPSDLPPVISQRAEEVTRGARTNFEKAVALQDWFRTKGGFTYSLDQRGGSGMSLLADFVTNDRVGYCEQFAAAMAAMGRSLGIPSRVVVGFLDGEQQADGRVLYTSDDRHAWPEMYFSGAGWVRFEPTPAARAGVTPAYTRQDTAAPETTPTTRPTPTPQQAPETSTPETDSTSNGSSLQVPVRPLLALLVVVGLGLAPTLLRRRQRRRRLAGEDPVHLAEGAWAELRATALDLGLEWPDRRSPREQARTVSEQVTTPPEDPGSLEGLLLDVERGRYARPGATGTVGTVAPEQRAHTIETVTAWRRSMLASVDRGRGWRGRLWPSSLLHRRR